MNGIDLIDTARSKLVGGLSAGALLTEERIVELEAAGAHADSGITAHLNGLCVISHHLYMCQDRASECMLNEAAWIIETLARSIEEMQQLKNDCDLYLNRKPEKKAGKGARS